METASTPAPYVAAADGDLAPKAAEPASTPEADASAEATFEEAVAALTETVNRAPLHREIFLKLLAFCTTQRTLAEAEEAARACPEFSSVAQSPYRLIRTLVHAGGLYWLELDETGRPLTPQAKAGLTPDEIEDATFAYAVVTTPVGEQVAEDLAPEKRLQRLFDLGLPPTWTLWTSAASSAPSRRSRRCCAPDPPLPSRAPPQANPCSRASSWTHWNARAALPGTMDGRSQRGE